VPGAPSHGGELGPQYNGAWVEAYLHTKWHHHPSPTLQQTGHSGQTGEWSCSIGRTVTCNGRPKMAINDARLAPTPKREAEIGRKQHKWTRSTRFYRATLC